MSADNIRLIEVDYDYLPWYKKLYYKYIKRTNYKNN